MATAAAKPSLQALDDLLAGLGIGPSAPGAGLPQGGGVQVTPSFTDTSTLHIPQLGGAAANQNDQGGLPVVQSPQPAAQDYATLDAVRAAPSARSDLPQLPGAPGQGQFAPPPLPKAHGLLANFLDKAVLGGAIANTDAQAYQRAAAAYQFQQLQPLYESLTPRQQADFRADPKAWLTTYAENQKRVNLKQGETTNNPQAAGTPGAIYSAPVWDEKSGTFVQDLGGGSILQTPTAGGAYQIQGNAVVSERTGPTGQTVSQPQIMGPDQHGNTFQPEITPTNGPLPQLGGPRPGPGPVPTAPSSPLPQLGGPPPAGVPTPAGLTQGVPGAVVTSGYRTPAHNAEVGGVPNSWHTTGTPDAPGALDVVPPTGMTMAQLAGQVAQKYPGARIINEGTHLHVQPNQRNVPGAGAPAAPAAPAGGEQTARGWSGPGPKERYGPKYFDAATATWRQHDNFSNEEHVMGDAAFKAQSAKQNFLESEPYKNYVQANDAFKAMVHAAALNPNGMRAYALRDTFARVINPGAVARQQVIESIKNAQGVPENIKAYLLNLTGDGDVPPATAQNILDVARGFLGSHYGSAKIINDANGAAATRSQQNPLDATMPMDAMPGNVHIGAMPDAKHLTPGDVYMLPNRGAAVFTGTGFKKYGG